MAEVRYDVWVELGARVPLDRLCRLLAGVERLGSIRQAAAALGLSYRYAWGLVRQAEAHLGAPLLQRRVGGASGGGADLTAAARDLLARYARFQAEVEPRVDAIFTGAGGCPGAAATGGAGPAASGVGGEAQGPGAAGEGAEAFPRPVVLASTIGPIECGLVPALAAAFVEDTGIPLRPVAAGSGQALDLAREGRVDLVLSHAPDLEQAFLAGGYGAGRVPLMYNDFLVVGPATDPAGVRGAPGAAAAFARIAAAGAPFLSRGDRSGTHLRELALWAAAGVTPGPPWYRVCPTGALGSGATLQAATAAGAYTLADRATYLAARAQGVQVAVLLAGDPVLHNEFALITLNPQRFPHLNHEGAARFVAWSTGPRGQALIARFGVDRYGQALFRPWGEG